MEYFMNQKLEKFSLLLKTNKPAAIRLAYEWTKTGHINLTMFTKLVDMLNENK